jgi:hypothetical protein
MFAPTPPEPNRPRFRTEREYREWQLSLRGDVPVRRFENEPGFMTRLAGIIRRLAAQRPHPVAEPRRIEQETSRLHG